MAFSPQIPLLIFAGCGFVALHRFGESNTFEQLRIAVETKVQAHEFTSIEGVDDAANLFVTFFWPCVDGNHPGLSVASFVFAGQWLSAWTVITIEGYREGNRGRLVSFISVFGLLYQSLGLGLVAPLYLFAHLFTSPTASAPTIKSVSTSTPAAPSILPAMVLGLIVPTVAMSLPLSTSIKAALVLFWQFFPVWTSILTLVFSNAFAASKINVSSAKVLRITYAIVIGLSTVAHISGLALSVTPLISPSLFNPGHSKGLVDAYLTFPPWPLDPSVKASSIAEGTLWFLQYDYLLTSLAFLFWSVAIRLAGIAKGTEPSGSQIATQCCLALARTSVLGPLGSAALLIWERDEDLLAQQDNGRKTIEARKTQ